MSIAMQLSHYETQQQKFGPVFADWGRTFSLWQEQFQSYPHKDQLQDYELQWKQWQEQMNSTSAHLQVQYSLKRRGLPSASGVCSVGCNVTGRFRYICSSVTYNKGLDSAVVIAFLSAAF